MFTEEELCILSQDDYYLPREQQYRDHNNEFNFDLPKSFDKKKFRKDIERLISGETVIIKEYTFNNRDAEPKILTFRPAPVLVIEGLFVLYFKKIAPMLDLKVFINAKENLKIIRRIMRDQARAMWLSARRRVVQIPAPCAALLQRFIQPYKEEADLVVNNNEDFERGLEVLVF